LWPPGSIAGSAEEHQKRGAGGKKPAERFESIVVSFLEPLNF
jgi:hypothetical protein